MHRLTATDTPMVRYTRTIFPSYAKDNPYLGPKMSDRFHVDTSLRYLVISKQLVFYNIKNDNIEIIRILDSRQDYLSLLF